MAKIPNSGSLGTFDMSVPASEAMRAGWTLFWMGVKARLHRRPWWSASVQMQVGYTRDEK